MINYAFSDISYKPDSPYPVYCYATSQFTDIKLINNDLIAHGVVLVNTKNKVIIISLPEYYLDMVTCKKSLAGLLGNNCSHTTLVVLAGNFARGILTLAPTNSDIINQPPIEATSIATIPDSMFPYQVPIILPLFGDYEVKQVSIEEKEVCESLCTYYPIGKL